MFMSHGYSIDAKTLLQLQRTTHRGNDSFAHLMAARGNTHLMRSLLGSATAVSEQSGSGGQRQETLSDLLIKTDSRGMTPLHCAVEKAHLEMVLLLLRHGADIDQFTNRLGDNRTPLAIAIELGHVEIVEALIKRGANLDVVLKCGAKTSRSGAALGAIHVARSEGARAIVEKLLARQVSIDSRLKDGRTPLMVALQRANHRHCPCAR